ncbi:hypothetical protein [Ramlibacter sp.]|uniref:DUF6916 family protein n=1 Tax=Ramlibacter sp. TaxID=1917967 RepID=UPI0017B3363C|nr:hypothetical protein [Ramlibacter sp.]MBA2672879.1 hypothetical protein [Ramlibacter sp.]
MALTIQQLAPQVGSSFTALTQGGPVPLELIDAEERRRGGLPPRFATPLSLLLRGPDDKPLVQASYQLEHPVLGQQLWLLVPVARPESAQQGSFYEIILSQLND